MDNILMVGNFSSGTGYAWRTINSCFAYLAERYVACGNKAYIVYPKVDTIHKEISNSGAEVIEYDIDNAGASDLIKFSKKKGITTLYLTDRNTISLKYLFFRAGGVSRIIVHDRTSGSRHTNMVKGLIKHIFNNSSFLSADKVIAISKFVSRRHVEVNRLPKSKCVTIYNGIDLNKFTSKSSTSPHQKFNINRNKKIIMCSARAANYKGVEYFIRAADLLIKKHLRDDLSFLFCGNGPDYSTYVDLIKHLQLTEYFRCPGEVDRIDEFLPQVFASVVPSTWQEGFGLAAVEAMASGVPVIASRVGGLAEIIDHGKDGFYTEAGDYEGIATQILALLENPLLRSSIAEGGMKKVRTCFDLQRTKAEIYNLCAGSD